MSVAGLKAWLARFGGKIEHGGQRDLARVAAAAKFVDAALKLHAHDVRAELDQIRETLAAATGQTLGALGSSRLSS